MDEFAGYKIIRELGKGGMGIVYEALDQKLNRKVALKLLHFNLDSINTARFIEEGRKLARLSHNSIVKIYECGQFEGTYFISLEYIEGQTLQDVIGKSLPLTRAFDVLKKVAKALGYAHKSGIIHRDIKPSNIFLSNDDRVVLGDFGIAKEINPTGEGLTRTGEFIGTVAYASPEQVQSRPLTPATDVYSLGIMAFVMVTGVLPFSANSPFEWMNKQVGEAPPPILSLAPNVPPALAEIIDRMLEKDPAKRPQNGAAVVKLLEEAQKAAASSAISTEIAHPIGYSPEYSQSSFEELEITASCFELAGFSRDVLQNYLPRHVAFLLESWYRLVHQAVQDEDGVIDRCVADRVTAIFGYPNQHIDHAQRAFRTAASIEKMLNDFNRSRDMKLSMRTGIACGPAMVGQVLGDVVKTSVQGNLMSDMVKLMKSKDVSETIRLNKNAYRRVGSLAEFKKFDLKYVGEAWAVVLVKGN